MKTAPVLLALVLLVGNTLALASPRATGKYVGSACTADADCYSKNCVFFNGARTKTCRRQPPGGPCVENNNCGSRLCSAQQTCTAAPTAGTCDTAADCTSALCTASRCQARTTTTLAPNAPCTADADCASGACQALASCFDSTGAEVRCSADPRHCTRLPNGSACANNGDCGDGFCRAGTCVASQTGDACVHQSQCTGAATCSTTGTCTTPATRSLYPQDICGADAQCFSGRCLPNLKYTDPYDQVFDYQGPFPQPTRCDYLALAQTKCRSYVDCTQGICKSQKCVLGVSGTDRCLFNQHCASGLCGASSTADGVCQRLPGNGSTDVGRPCSTNAQCATQRCERGFIRRPVPTDPATLVYVQDLICVQSDAGGPCITDSQCAQGACRGGRCTPLTLGQSCAADPQCASYNCALASAASTSLTCATAEFEYPCSANTDCFSNVCTPATSLCAAVPPAADCRTDSDCDYNRAICEPASRKCRNIHDKPCTADAQCLSGTCATTGLCT